jgi:hypothetical protein
LKDKDSVLAIQLPTATPTMIVQTSWHVEKPAKFNGKEEDLELFIIMLQSTFILQEKRFLADMRSQYKAMYTASLMIGRAL